MMMMILLSVTAEHLTLTHQVTFIKEAYAVKETSKLLPTYHHHANYIPNKKRQHNISTLKQANNEHMQITAGFAESRGAASVFKTWWWGGGGVQRRRFMSGTCNFNKYRLNEQKIKKKINNFGINLKKSGRGKLGL
jgi:hypothetical protein